MAAFSESNADGHWVTVTVVSRSLISVLLFSDGHFFKINADGHLVMVTVVNCSTFLVPCFFQFQKKINADGHQVTVTVVNCSRLWVFSVVNCPVMKCLCSNCTTTTHSQARNLQQK